MTGKPKRIPGTKEALKSEDNVLRTLFDLFASEGNSVDMDLRRLAEEHYTRRFGDMAA